eukprot:6490573-Amphidinium_carterae.3
MSVMRHTLLASASRLPRAIALHLPRPVHVQNEGTSDHVLCVCSLALQGRSNMASHGRSKHTSRNQYRELSCISS